MRRTRLSFAIVVISIVTLIPSISKADPEFFSYAFGKVYASRIDSELLRKSPDWRETDDNPPVSARKAIRLADAKRQKLVKDTEQFKWKRVRASLEWGLNDPGCYWRIRYEAHRTIGGESGIAAHLDLFVLMDGTLIDPDVSDDKR